MSVKDSIVFNVRGLPQTKGSTKAFMRPGMRYPVITNDNTKTKGWAETIKLMAQQKAPDVPWEGPVRLILNFWLKKPQNYPKTFDLWHIKKPDLDKLVRAVKDALKDVIYKDDSQVVQLVTNKEYGGAPGVDVTIYKLAEGE